MPINSGSDSNKFFSHAGIFLVLNQSCSRMADDNSDSDQNFVALNMSALVLKEVFAHMQ